MTAIFGELAEPYLRIGQVQGNVFWPIGLRAPSARHAFGARVIAKAAQAR